MTMARATGFCDLNIIASDADLENTILKALSMGYKTLAINKEVTDKTKAEKTSKKGANNVQIPSPKKIHLSKEKLLKHGITFTPVILNRLTVIYSDPSSAFLHKGQAVLQEYDLVAFRPTTDAALKQVCMSYMCADIISLDTSQTDLIMPRKLLRAAIERDIYFEICYGPTLTGSFNRQNVIMFGHSLHKYIKSKNIFVSSQAQNPKQLRRPYDVMNLARFFGLTEAGAKESIGSVAHDLVYCAVGRRNGESKCFPKIDLISSNDINKYKYCGLDDASLYAKHSIN